MKIHSVQYQEKVRVPLKSVTLVLEFLEIEALVSDLDALDTGLRVPTRDLREELRKLIRERY